MKIHVLSSEETRMARKENSSTKSNVQNLDFPERSDSIEMENFVDHTCSFTVSSKLYTIYLIIFLNLKCIAEREGDRERERKGKREARKERLREICKGQNPTSWFMPLLLICL